MTDHIFMRKNHIVFKSWWGAAGSGVVDGTWGADTKKAQIDLNHSAEDILHSKFVQGKTFNELKNYKDQPNKMDVANISDPKRKQAAELALKTLFDPENESWMDENLKGKLPNWRDLLLFESIYALYDSIGYVRIERLKT